MFDSSALKGMKLPELQEIAKLAKTIKFNGVKKENLIEEILKHQANSANDTAVEKEVPKEDKIKRVRIAPETKSKSEKASQNLFSEETVESTFPDAG